MSQYKDYTDVILKDQYSKLNRNLLSKLRKCPYCTGLENIAVKTTKDNEFYVSCDCGAKGQETKTENYAIKAWNLALNKNSKSGLMIFYDNKNSVGSSPVKLSFEEKKLLRQLKKLGVKTSF
jgi:hypothetical protein